MEFGTGNQVVNQKDTSPNELLFALAQWQRAACLFHEQYMALQEIASTQQAASVLPQSEERLVCQCSFKELERASLDMARFLEKILQDMERTEGSLEQTIKDLHWHTAHLQELIKKVQQTIWLCSLSAC